MQINNKGIADQNYGTVAFGGISGTYATTLAITDGAILTLLNKTDQPVIFSLNGGTNDYIKVFANDSHPIDFGAAGLRFTGTVSVKHAGVAPTSGEAIAAVIRRDYLT